MPLRIKQLLKFCWGSWVGLLLLALIIHAQSLGIGFMIDDGDVIRFYHQHGLQAFFDQHLMARTHNCFRPVGLGLFGLLYSVLGEHTVLYHIFGMVTLSFAAWSLFMLLRVVFQWEVLTAFLAAALFVAHPFSGLNVNYIGTEYMNVAAGLLLMSCWLAYQGSVKNIYRVFIYALITFGLALLCHESALVTPAWLVFMWRAKGSTWADAFKKVVPWLGIAALYMLLRSLYLSTPDFVLNAKLLSTHMVAFVQLCGHYLEALVYPVSVIPTYGVSANIPMQNMWKTTIVAGLFVGLIACFRKNSEERLGLSWLAVGLLPLIVACFKGEFPVLVIQPNWLIPTLVGFVVFVSACLRQLNLHIKGVALVVGLLFISLWGVISWQYAKLWQKPNVFYAYWAEQVPAMPGIYCHLAEIYERNNDFNLASHFYGQCYLNHKGESLANYYFTLGVLDLKQLKWTQAEQNFGRALVYKPNFPEASYNLEKLRVSIR